MPVGLINFSGSFPRLASDVLEPMLHPGVTTKGQLINPACSQEKICIFESLVFNPLMLTVAKRGLTILMKFFKQNHGWENI